jgi:sterol 3beta-glucosyltransferase
MITILTAGTRGDTQPYLALGIALKRAGQEVRIATFKNYEAFVKGLGLGFYPIQGDISTITTSDSTRHARTADNPLKFFLSFNKLKSLVFDLQKDFFKACAGSQAVVYHPGAAIGYFIAGHYQIPSILATPFPMTPTREYPALIFYNTPRVGKFFNLATHKIFEKILWFASSAAVKRFWRAEFGRAPEWFACPYPKQNTRTLPTITSCSNYVFPRPKDWPAHVTNTGYWFLNDEADWQPSEDLLHFIQGGTPPVYVGFGSLGDPAQAAQTTELVIRALKRSGQRGILATGWQGMSHMEALPEGIFILESAPHAWLFPQMAAVVHHGGAGTTAAGLRAGVPGIIVPFSNDQFAWGRRVYELGVGPKPIPRKNLTTERLSEAINAALGKEIKAAAKDLGEKIQSENGAETAAKIILDCFEA